MTDRTVSTTLVFACLFWLIGSAIVGLSLVYDRNGIAATGLLFAGYGGCLTVKHFLNRLAEDIVARERNAFDLGRDYARLHSVDE